MKKSTLLWCGGFFALCLVVLTVFFLGRAPLTVPVWSALPSVDDSTPHLLLVGKGEDIPSGELLEPLEGALPGEAFIDRVKAYLPLLGEAERFAMLLSLEEGVPEVYGAFYPGREVLSSLKKGEVPAPWADLSPPARSQKGELLLSAGGEQQPLVLRPRGRMVLFSRRAGGLDRMEGILEKEEPSLDVSWDLRPGWTSHLRLNDAGHLGDILFMGGIDVGTVPLSAEVAWRRGPGGNDLAWKFDGVRDLLSEWGFPHEGSPEGWSRPMTMPGPSLLTLGVDFPPQFLRRFRNGMRQDWARDLGFSSVEADALLSGPMVFSLGGRSKLFLFSAPGMYLQLFDRGALGRELVDRLWSESWYSMAERRKTIPGFSFGGGVSRPFSVVGAARNDLVLLGLLDPAQVDEERAPDDFLPFDPRGSFLWFYGDFPGLASSLRKWARLGEYARNAGFEVGEMHDTFERIESLRSLGRVTLALRTPFEGWVSWSGDVR